MLMMLIIGGGNVDDGDHVITANIIIIKLNLNIHFHPPLIFFILTVVHK